MHGDARDLAALKPRREAGQRDATEVTDAYAEGYDTPSSSAASLVPSTRLRIFCHAVSRAKSGEP